MIVIDTHVLVWALQNNPRLGADARKRFEAVPEAADFRVSAITPWEIALLVRKGRLTLEMETGAWMNFALALPGLSLAPLTPAIAIDSVNLPGDFHSDPSDRIIVATARSLGVPVLTADQAILRYAEQRHVDVIDATR